MRRVVGGGTDALILSLGILSTMAIQPLLYGQTDVPPVAPRPSMLDWVEPQLPTVPSQRCCVGMAYDRARHSAVLFGGGNGGVYPRVVNQDTWVWRDGWTQRFPGRAPSARQGAGMTYDASTGVVVLFGGDDVTGASLGDTWIWDGLTWIQQFPPQSPSPREFDIQSMVYDAATQTVLLFGGHDAASDKLGDTWEWNGKTKTWIQLFPSASPSPRWTTLAYDEARKQIVLFGGSTDGGDCCSTYLNDTWTWDGVTWTPQFPLNSPPPRADASMAYDESVGRVVLFGGFSTPGQGLDDTWAWDGTAWTQLQPVNHPGGPWAAGMVDDPLSKSLLLFGGEVTGHPFVNTTWQFMKIPAR